VSHKKGGGAFVIVTLEELVSFV